MCEETGNYSNMDDDLGILKFENNLGISFRVFDILYPLCKDIITKLKILDPAILEKSDENKNLLNMASKVILCLNGEIKTAFT